MIDRWLPRWLASRPRLALLLLAASLLLWHLGSYGLWESTEARYAEISARMVRSGDWLTPRLNWIAHFEKPPLTYWATAAGMLVFGVTELGARIGLVVAAVAVLAIVHGHARDTAGPRAAGYALLALLSAPLFFALSRSVTTDLYLTLFVVGAVEAGRRGSRPGARRGWRIAAWAAVGAGFLTKGPVVLLWTALPALVWAALAREWRRLARLVDPVGIAVAAALALPWYLVLLDRHPALLDDWIGRQTVGRMTAPVEGERAPAWFYLPVLLWAAGPWIVPAAVGWARRVRHAPYTLVWTLAPLLAFSLFPTKRANYLLPLVPAVAVAAGAWWAAAEEGRAPGWRGAGRTLAVLAVALGAGLAIAAARAGLPLPLRVLGAAAGPGFVMGGWAAWTAVRRDRPDLVFAGWLVPLLGLYVGGYAALGLPSVERRFKISRPLAAAVAAERRPGEAVVAWHDWPRAFPFYLDVPVVTITSEGRDTRFERDGRWRELVFTEDSAVGRWARDGRRTFYVLPRGERAELERALGVRLEPLTATRRHLLAVDRPAGLSGRPPSEAARSGPAAPR